MCVEELQNYLICIYVCMLWRSIANLRFINIQYKPWWSKSCFQSPKFINSVGMPPRPISCLLWLLNICTTQRQYCLKLFKTRQRIQIAKIKFPYEIISDWNCLYNLPVSVSYNTDRFLILKVSLDEHWSKASNIGLYSWSLDIETNKGAHIYDWILENRPYGHMYICAHKINIQNFLV